MLNDNNSSNSFLIDTVLALVYQQTGHDFTHYKRNTLQRRIERRYLRQNFTALADYVDFLETHPHEIAALYDELLICVTQFFRDPQSFEAARAQIVPQVVTAADRRPIRIWVPACATGEEAYSWAMLFIAYLEQREHSNPLQIFASDVDRQAILSARTGIYSAREVASVPADFLSRYFDRTDNNYRLIKNIRDTVIFGVQNALQDPPYSRLDLISCRNLFIYLNPELQHKLLTTFHYALKPNGFLFLGNAESLGEASGYFQTTDQQHRIFQKSEVDTPVNHLWQLTQAYTTNVPMKTNPSNPNRPLSQIAQQVILERFIPACVIINNKGDILYVQGKMGDFLELSTGALTSKIIDLARDGLKIPLSSTIRLANETNTEAFQSNLRVEINGTYKHVHLSVTPLSGDDVPSGILLVVFRKADIPPQTAGSSTDPDTDTDDERILSLKRELLAKEDYLRNIIHQLEASNEALISANEEAQSTNEEFQSINEELETSKEELQSVNEELITTNNELQNKVTELSHVNNVLKNLLSSTNIATIFLDVSLHIFEFTTAVSDIVDLRRGDIGRPLSQFTNALHNDNLVEEAKTVLQTLEPFEKEVTTADERVFWMRILPYYTTEETVEGVVITFTDITTRKQQEAELNQYQTELERLVEERTGALKKNEAMLARTEHYAKIGSWEWEIATDTVTWSAELFNLFQLDPADGAPPFAEHDKLHSPEELARLEKVVTAAVEQGQPYEIELSIKRSDGEIRHCVGRGFPEYDDNNQVVKLMGSFQDITKRKEAEEALMRSNQQLHLAVETAQLGVWEVDLATGILNWNDEILKIYGLSREAFNANVEGWRELVYPEDRIAADAEFEKIMYGQTVSDVRFRIKTPQGEVKYIYASGAPIFDEAGNIIKLIGINIDVTNIVKYEQALADQEEQFTNITSNLPGAVLKYQLFPDGTDNLLYLSKGSEEIWEIPYEEVLPHVSHLWSSILEEDMADMQASIIESAETLSRWDHEWRIRTSNGQLKWLNGRGVPKKHEDDSVVWDTLILDITHRKETEAEREQLLLSLQQTRKIASMGRLAGGIAHDFNNLLVPILGYAELGTRRTAADEKISGYFSKIYQAAKRGSEITNQILAFSRKQVLQMETVNPNQIITNFLKLSQRLLGEQITVHLSLTAEPYQVRADSNQIDQVLMNLMINARDAMNDSGQITITSQNVHLDQETVQRLGGNNQAGNYFLFTISDAGQGIDEEVKRQMFEPFFTTKERGKGTGLGLATVLGIVTQHKGFVDVESEIGRGSHFHIYLPREKESMNITNQTITQTTSLSGNETILVVEDDELVRKLIVEALEIHTYNVLEADTPTKAIAIADSFTGKIDLLVTDVIMPEMNGRELQQTLTAAHAHLRTIYVSGYIDNNIVHEAILEEGAQFLQKPFEIEMLLLLVRQICDQKE